MSHPHPPRRFPSAAPSWWAAPLAFLATLLALPVNAAITVPDAPLTTINRVAPNILFILDDSGSMAFDYMPDDVPNTSTPDVSNLAYPRNTLSYNPRITYQPWMGADGNRMSGGTTYDAVYGSFNLVGGRTIDLGNSGSCRRFNHNTNATSDELSSGGNQVCGGRQTFYVPKDAAATGETYLGDGTNYYRYDIVEGGAVILRSIWGRVVQSDNSLVVSPSSGTVRGRGVNTHDFAKVPDNARLTINIKSSLRSVMYEVQRPGGGTVCNGQVNEGGTSTCTVASTDAGSYRLLASRWNETDSNASYTISASYQTTNRCGTGTGSFDWIDCVPALPNADRTLGQELANYATWFSYHRTRMKAAKAGASEAFRPLDSKVRVGFRTIHGRAANHSAPIPVTKGDGRFVNDSTASISNRNDWYASLHGAIAYSGTPLQQALDAAGQYFSLDDSGGPYGPESGSAQLSCRQNFAILTTDGYWNGNNTGAGNVDDKAGTQVKGPNGKSYTYSPAPPYKDAFSNTLADVAMKYWLTDLRTEDHMGSTTKPDNNNVPTTDADPAFWQHMVTFGISIGLKTSRGWSSVEEAKAKIAAGGSWPDPETTKTSGSDSIPARLDDLLHAAVNGRGAFVSASNPAEFTTGLAHALAAIAQRTSSFSNVATNAASVRQGGKVFNAAYVAGLWTGSVKAWNLDANNNPASQAWEASIPAATDRKIFTYGAAGGATFPTGTQVGQLLREGGPVDYPVSGADNAAYIKGDARLEERNGGLLRNRTTTLGDIVGSSPAYVEDTNTLYVGANDGMLHAFDAANGKELFAYVPSLINLSHLATLSRGDYGHKWFVDGPVVVSDRKLTPNKNLLVGALGRGGKGLFGLDVTAPASFGAGNVKWELAETPGKNMGLVTGRPILARLADGKKVAILGNGINSTNHKAVLLVVDLETGAVLREYETGAGSATVAAQNNGLSAPTATLGPDGLSVQYAFAGDRLGNVWKFDLTKAPSATGAVKKLFTAKSNDGAGAVQPITGAVTVATDPRTYKRWVLFGTGSYVTTGDADDKTVGAQSMYGFIDSDTELAYDDLQKRTIINTGKFVDGYPVRSFEAQASLPAGKKGWYVNLPGAGERVVQDSQVVANILLTASMIPEGDACEASGSGYINAVDAFTGTSAGKSFFDLDGDGDTGDTLVGGVPVGSVNFGVGMPTLPVVLDGKLVVGGTGGSVGSEKPGAGGIVGMQWSRVSWREVRAD